MSSVRDRLLLALSQASHIDDGDIPASARAITEAAVEGLGIDRCGVWMRAADGRSIRCNPGARVMTWREWEPMAAAAEIAQHCRPPKEVDERRWWDLLECMFPANWHGTGSAAESFMLVEPYTDTLRVCMVLIGDRYAEMIRPKTTTHGQLCDEARALFSAAAPQS